MPLTFLLKITGDVLAQHSASVFLCITALYAHFGLLSLAGISRPGPSGTLIRMRQSKVWDVRVGHPAIACLPRFLWHSSYTIVCVRNDWLRAWLCFFPARWLAGWELHITRLLHQPKCEATVFLASLRLDEHHRNNKKDAGDVNHQPKRVCLAVDLFFSSLHILLAESHIWYH